MSLLGIDVGTTGCKVSVFDHEGETIASAYVEYDVQRPSPGWTELDAGDIWQKIKRTLAEAAGAASAAKRGDTIQSVAVSSLGEATVPVTEDRRILGPSLLNSDARGEEYLDHLASVIEDEWLYRVNGNVLGNHYSLTKLLWVQQHQPEIYDKAYKFLHWGPFVSFMLGAEPRVDYSLANRTLLFDLDAETWSDDLLERTGLDRSKLPETAPSGTKIGTVSDKIAEELGLPRGISIATGAHDQCSNAVGCGVTRERAAMYGMGTVICIVPVFRSRREPGIMIPRGLNTEHHAVPGRFVSFIYNQGGCLVKWFRDTFAAEDRRRADEEGRDIYGELFSEIPEGPSPVIVLPHFEPTGPPQFISDSCGVIAGLKLGTSRGDILKGILEGSTYYLRQLVDELPATGTTIDEYCAVGGGSRSDAWVQLCCDILGRPFTRPRITEAGALGAAILGGIGRGTFTCAEEAAKTMVKQEHIFEPDLRRHERYTARYQEYNRLGPLMRDYLRDLANV